MTIRPSSVIRVAALLAVLSPVPAFAQGAQTQDAPQLGIVAATPGNLAVIWNYSEQLAIRPSLGFAHNSTSTDPPGAETSSTSWSPGISVLLYTRKWDAVRAYVTPAYQYSHTSSDLTTGGGATSESNTNSHQFSGSIGAQYDPQRHFGAFGEIGLAFTHSSAQVVGAVTTSKNNAWSIRTAVGAIFFF